MGYGLTDRPARRPLFFGINLELIRTVLYHTEANEEISFVEKIMNCDFYFQALIPITYPSPL